MRKSISIAAAIASILLLMMSSGCASNNESAGAPGTNLLGGEQKAQASKQAICFVNPIRKHKANGIFTFTPVPQGLRIVGGLTGLTPGIHALHLHENDDCSASASSSRGSTNHLAGSSLQTTNSTMHHVGDLGNFAADANGEAKIDFTNSVLTLTGAHSILGKSLIVYEGSDNPTNHLGERVACGVIQMKPPKP